MSSAEKFSLRSVLSQDSFWGLSDMGTVKEVYYPKYSPTRAFYDACRTPHGGYGGLLSITFHSTAAAVIFFDAIEIAKGPSLGTNFTLWLVIFVC